MSGNRCWWKSTLVRIAVIAAFAAVPAAALATAGASQVWVAGNCLHSQYKPKSIVLTCADGNTLLQKLSWSAWTAKRASGAGRFAINTCTPTCVTGHIDSYSVKVVLSAPKRCPRQQHEVFTHAALTFGLSRLRPLDSWKLFCPSS